MLGRAAPHGARWLLLAAAAAACLPDDTRSEPGSVVVNVRADATLSGSGFSTADDFDIVYRRVLIVVGDVELDGSDCEQYSENGYSRILELPSAEPQRLSLVHGLGHCDFAFLVSTPQWDTLLGAGVQERDAIFMRTPGSDAHAENAGVSIYVEGTAERLGITKRFAWPFRRFIQYEKCDEPRADAFERGISLNAARSIDVELVVRGDALFADSADAAVGSARFEAFRAADDEYGDADGEVTLAELDRAPGNASAEPGATTEPTLGDVVYLERLPGLVRFGDTGACESHASSEEPDGGGF